MNTALEYSTRVQEWSRRGAVDVKRVLLRFSTPDPSKNTFNEPALGEGMEELEMERLIGKVCRDYKFCLSQWWESKR
jgi:hypothetical protein